MKKLSKKEDIKITLEKGEVLTDYYDNGGDATDLDDVEEEKVIVVEIKK